MTLASRQMRAAWYDQQGPAREVLVVGSMPLPEPREGEVRVRVHVTGPNPSDVKRRSGFQGMPMPFPRIVPHSDGAGIIDEVGAGVSEDRLGERVWIFNAGWQRPFGSAAEWITLPASLAVPLPPSASFALGACLGIPALTAHMTVFGGGSLEGSTVLVTGGAGAVGYYAVQLAKWGGAEVIATVSSPEKAAVAERAGADHVIDYRRADVAAEVAELTAGRGVSRIVDVAFGANLGVDASVITPGGTIATYGSDSDHEPRLPFYPLLQKNVTLQMCFVYLLADESRRVAVADINAAIEQGALDEHISHRLALEDVVTAHELLEGGQAVGNVVVSLVDAADQESGTHHERAHA
jgi:NADPH:quinone reductase